jgi:hypothetical protein
MVYFSIFFFEENAKPDIESARVQFGDDKTYIDYIMQHYLTLKLILVMK